MSTTIDSDVNNESIEDYIVELSNEGTQNSELRRSPLSGNICSRFHKNVYGMTLLYFGLHVTVL